MEGVVQMKANHLRAIALVIIAIPASIMVGYINGCVISAFKMEERITFSGMMFVVTVSTPLLCYFLFFSMYFFIFNNLPIYNELICIVLFRILLVSIFISPFVSMYITYKAMHNGYIECEKISWMSPNNFVKPPETCD
jgi:uncharacterized protein YneF (UPF0154 family)